jgi:hypothetical protein
MTEIGEGTTFFFTLPKPTSLASKPQPLWAEPVGSPG